MRNEATGRPDTRVMSEQPPTPDETPRRRDHLSVVTEPEMIPASAAARPRTIGRVIAQTALLADSALHRRRAETPETRGMGRLLGRFR
jgi:hypothetical protein